MESSREAEEKAMLNSVKEFSKVFFIVNGEGISRKDWKVKVGAKNIGGEVMKSIFLLFHCVMLAFHCICLFSCLQLPPAHPSIYPSSPFCQLAHVNFAFPHCFFWGKVPLLLIKPTALLQYHDSLPSQHTHTSTSVIHHTSCLGLAN